MQLFNQLTEYGVPESLIEELRQLTLTDPLTELYNRRFIEPALDRARAAARRYNRPFSLILLDLDNLKTINDTHGHPAGDKAIRQLADALRKTLRAADLAGRWGGDEFIVILPETDAAGAQRLVERLKQQAGPVAFTVGIATLPCDDLLVAADAALRNAKVGRRH
jgi:diguanylate cyclase (GGDEF)-like protein